MSARHRKWTNLFTRTLGAVLLLGGEPEVDEKTGGAAIVADEVRQEDAGDVGVELEHGYTDG